MLDIDDAPKKRVPVTYKPPTAEMLAYLDFSVTNSGTLIGIKVFLNILKIVCLYIVVRSSGDVL